MIICGLKLTHDGAIALIDNGKLIFSYEMEKLNNNARFAELNNFNDEFFTGILQEHGYSIQDIDQIVIDGWGDFNGTSPQDDAEDYPVYTTRTKGINGEFDIALAKYGLRVRDQNLLEKTSFQYPEQQLQYNSYLHVSGHVMSAYCTSSFARQGEDSFVLVWDGGMCPQLFYVHHNKKEVENLGPIFNLLGGIYGAFASNYKPFNHLAYDDPTIAGVVMAYIAKGQCRPDVLAAFKGIFQQQEKDFAAQPNKSAHVVKELTTKLLQDFLMHGEMHDVDSIDMMATLHVFVQEILVEQLSAFVSQYPGYTSNLCFAGGCALNIKWNSSIRSSGVFKDMWVPPFPNDSGSAVGAACCEMVTATGQLTLEWDVYSGPLIRNEPADDTMWNSIYCSIKDLAALLHTTNEPVVFLNGRAELGPRALGNRSILAAAVSEEMKTVLNKLKLRENYRPVAPICIEEDAPGIFTPGTPDPLMLYDHMVKEEWKDRIPAICHLDGSARLQTVSKAGNPEVYELLSEYKKLSGVPLLCNTSANFKGKGFFPDNTSAMSWGETDMVWCAATLYVKRGSRIAEIVERMVDTVSVPLSANPSLP